MGSLFGAVGVFLFVLAIGAFMTMVLATGALDVAIGKLAYAMRGRPWLVIVAVMALFSLLGTTMGWADETLGFYALLIPLMLVLGYDRMAAAGMIIASTTVGSMASTVNPFSIGVASEFADVELGDGIALRWIGWFVLTTVTIVYVVRYAERSKAQPDRSLVGFSAGGPRRDREGAVGGRPDADRAPEARARDHRFQLRPPRLLGDSLGLDHRLRDDGSDHPRDRAERLLVEPRLVVPGADRALPRLLGRRRARRGFGEKQITGNITKGFGDFIGAGVAVVLARGVTVILNNTQTIDTVLSWMESAVSGTSAVGFTSILFLVNIGIAFIIPSSSGHATLAMPLLAPLGDFADVSRPLVVTAWSWGAGVARFVTPTSAVVMAGIALAGVRYDRWIRFMLPLMGLLAATSLVMLGIAAALE